MWNQHSYQSTNSEIGQLYLVPTPIGNLEDMTYRAVHILKEVDRIAAEDTRNTKKLCRHFGIETSLVSYHEHNKDQSGDALLSLLKEGKNVAVVSDAGMPVISDPGFEFVHQCLQEEIAVIPLPGANAAITALIGSGLRSMDFYFYGFLSRKKKDRERSLQWLQYREETLLFYEAPHRLKETLSSISKVLGERQVVVARELTKIHEEWLRGTISQLLENIEHRTIKGECCLVVEGIDEERTEETYWWEDLTVIQHVNHYVLIREWSKKQAIKQVSIARELPKREVYNTYHQEFASNT